MNRIISGSIQIKMAINFFRQNFLCDGLKSDLKDNILVYKEMNYFKKQILLFYSY